MKRQRSFPRVLSLLLCLAMALSLAPTAWAAKPQAAASTNINTQNYNDTYHASTVKSYLYENESGGLTRVEYIYDYNTGGKVIVEDYDSGFVIQSSRTIAPELPVWGGFFAGEDYNFLIFGQNNEEENDSKEVIRVVKYDKNWNRLGSASLYGANTTIPFRSGSLRCDEYGGWLYIRASHQMYTAKDGKNHQASLMLLVREDDMEITEYACQVGGAAYVSHSFNQFILIDQEQRIVALDHGDAYPRSIVLQRLIAKAGQGTFTEEKYVETASGPGWSQGYIVCEEETNIQTFPGSTGANDTGCSVGGLAETSSGYVTAYSYDGVGKRFDARDIYMAFIGEDLSVKNIQLTSGANTATPQVAALSLDRGYVMWNQKVVKTNQWGNSYTELGDTLHYVAYASDGTRTGVKTAASAPLSDCQPISYNGKVVWYVTNGGVPTFYALDDSGVQTMVSDARSRFADLSANAFYLDPVAWAVNRGITTGRTATTFAPTQTCTHGEILTFLWRAAGKPASSAQPPIDMTGKEFYYDAAKWAAEKGMIDANFNPNAPCNRAYAVLYIWQAFGKPAPSKDSPFTDVPAHWSSAPAVAWALEKGITTGKTATTFNPSGICSRGEIVTFLYRAYK